MLGAEQLDWQEGLDGLRSAPYPSVATGFKELVRESQGLKQDIAVRYYRSWLRAFRDLKAN